MTSLISTGLKSKWWTLKIKLMIYCKHPRWRQWAGKNNSKNRKKTQWPISNKFNKSWTNVRKEGQPKNGKEQPTRINCSSQIKVTQASAEKLKQQLFPSLTITPMLSPEAHPTASQASPLTTKKKAFQRTRKRRHGCWTTHLLLVLLFSNQLSTKLILLRRQKSVPSQEAQAITPQQLLKTKSSLEFMEMRSRDETRSWRREAFLRQHTSSLNFAAAYFHDKFIAY